MLAPVRHPGFILIATLLAGLFLFGGYCYLHALTVGVALPWNGPSWWGLIAGVPAEGLMFALWHWRDWARDRVQPISLAAAMFGGVLCWGVVARGVIGPGQVPHALKLVEQLFVILPVVAAFAGAAALVVSRRALAVDTIAPWIELPEEPLLRLRTEEVGWVSAAGNYCEFHVADRVHLVRVPLARAAGLLKPQGFARAHRSTLVNLAALTSVEPGSSAKRPVARLRSLQHSPRWLSRAVRRPYL